MMRFFRGKDIKTDEWVEGDLIISKNQHYIHPTHNSFQVKESGLSGPIVLHEVREDTVGQFTGVFDKKGNKIFEGDIIKFWSQLYIVGYSEKKCCFLGHRSHMPLECGDDLQLLCNGIVVSNVFDYNKKDV